LEYEFERIRKGGAKIVHKIKAFPVTASGGSSIFYKISSQVAVRLLSSTTDHVRIG
jgi:hypothetical protein